ncbi:MAG: hypothetical protein ACRDJE_28205 [Dehalococcoidia bacterium]
MTTEQTGTLVLKDSTGSYYLVSQEMLEQIRVPAEHTAEIEEMIAAAQSDAGGDDVQGHHPIAVGVAAFAIVYWSASMGYYVTRYLRGPEEAVPHIDYSGVGSREPLPLPGGGH